MDSLIQIGSSFYAGLSGVPPLALLALCVIAAVGVLYQFSSLWRALAKPRYIRAPGLFSAQEWDFHRALEQTVGTDYAIFGKVRLADLMTPDKKGSKDAWWRAFTKISSKHVDFVLLDRRTAEILIAIEIDDRSHGQRERQDRDSFVNEAFAQAGIPLLRWNGMGRGKYKADEIGARIRQCMVERYGNA